MKINPDLLRTALHEWSQGITQFTATQRITKAYFELGLTIPAELHQIEYPDGTVDYDAWRNNNQNIFHRWRKCKTEIQRENFSAISSAILHAMDPEVRAMVTAGKRQAMNGGETKRGLLWYNYPRINQLVREL